MAILKIQKDLIHGSNMSKKQDGQVFRTQTKYQAKIELDILDRMIMMEKGFNV